MVVVLIKYKNLCWFLSFRCTIGALCFMVLLVTLNSSVGLNACIRITVYWNSWVFFLLLISVATVERTWMVHQSKGLSNANAHWTISYLRTEGWCFDLWAYGTMTWPHFFFFVFFFQGTLHICPLRWLTSFCAFDYCNAIY